MDDTPRLKAGLRRKRLIGLMLVLLASWVLYQWYYVSPSCSPHSKHVWMWLTPVSDRGLSMPGQTRFVLLRLPSAYVPKYENAEFQWGGKVGFLNLHLTLGENKPYCLRYQRYTHYDSPRVVSEFPADGFYRDGFDLKKIYVRIESGALRTQENHTFGTFEGKPKKEAGFDVFESSVMTSSTDHLFFKSPSGEITRSGECDKSNPEKKRTLCAIDVRHKGVNIQYIFHASLLPEWPDIEKQTLNYIDRITIINF